jgi:ABC-type nitrate/sulfonate/bicarbonate transport system permease component
MKLRGRSRRLLAGLAAAGVVVGLWYAVALLATHTRGVDFPTPWQTLRSLADLLAGRPLSGHSLYRHVLHSLLRWAVGFAVASAAGIAYGLLAGSHAGLERLTVPTVHVLQLVPGLAWIPAAILLFGIGERATVFLIAVTAFPPVAINVLGGVKRVDATYLRAARMMGTGRLGLLLRVLIPGALPQALSGLRIGLGNGWRVLVAAEMIVGTGTGLGYSIIQARWTLDYASAFACVAVICLVGLLVERLVLARLERRTVERWELARTP